MKKVIDTNRLQSDELFDYLAASPRNYAVLTDFAGMEALKGNTLASIYKSMKIVGQFPKQTIILKGSRVVCAMRGRRSGLQRRLIDENQTEEFSNYIQMLRKAELGDPALQRSLLRLGVLAEEHIEDRMMTEAMLVAPTFDVLAKLYTKDERAIIRNGGDFTSAMIGRFGETLMEFSVGMFSNSPVNVKKPTYEELPNTLYFRLALCGYLLALRRGAEGGTKDSKIEKIRNDLVDISFAAYGTYFDGLMTADNKIARIHADACMYLSGLFDAEIPSLRYLSKRGY